MATTTAGSLQADVRQYLAEETLPIAQRWLGLHTFGQQFSLERGHGTVMTFSRYQRVALPYAPLAEGVPPVAQGLTLQQVTGTVQQWGGQITITDVGELTIFHNPFQQAKKLAAYQLAETLDRNDFLTLNGITQINYVGSVGARANLTAGSVLDPYTISRTWAALDDAGAPMFNGPPASEPNPKYRISEGQPRAGSSPRAMPHYVSVSRGFPIQDLRQNNLVNTAWSYSDVDKLYNFEVGEWSGIRFCRSNMAPSWTGVAQVNGTPGSSGSLANGTYFIQVTGSDSQNQYESRIYQVSAAITVIAGPNGSIQVTTPNIANFTFNIYLDTSASVAHLGLTTSGPTTGAMTGQAVQIPPNTTVTLTGIGFPQTPPAAPATGVTVYRVYVFGEDAFGVINLQGGGVEWSYLNQPEKADPNNQLRIVAWKTWQGAMILNSQFIAAIECASAFGPTFG